MQSKKSKLTELQNQTTLKDRFIYKRGGPSRKTEHMLAFARSLGDIDERERLSLTVIEFSKPEYGYKDILSAAQTVKKTFHRWESELESRKLSREESASPALLTSSALLDMFISGELSRSEYNYAVKKLKSGGKS